MSNNIDIEKLAVKFGIDYTEEFGKVLKQFAEAYAAEKQRQQEPVAWIVHDDGIRGLRWTNPNNGMLKTVPLYTTPPDQSREIEELKATVKKWQENSVDLEYSCLDKNILITELQVNNNRLREALELAEKAMAYDVELVKEALSKTPAQSLQEFENEVIERCAETAYAFLDDPYLSGHGYATGCSDAILALKEGD